MWLACGSEPPLAEGTCATYADAARSWCELAEAAEGPDVERCTRAGAFEDECRLRWVRRHLKSATPEELVAACSTEECRFDAIDGRPAPLLEQLARCDELTDTAPFCRQHAALRWLDAGHPDLETVLTETRWPDDIGRALGHLSGCAEGPACETLALPLQGPCGELLAEVRADPDICAR